MRTIKVKEIMTADPILVRPTQTVKEAAKLMKDNDIGILPVGDQEGIIGMLTDRDITVRLTAEGKDAAKTPVEEVMSTKFITCNENDEIEHAAELMRKHDISRIIVSDFDRVTGIVTLADLIRNKGDRPTSEKVLHELLRPAGAHKTHCSTKMDTADTGCEC